jgi:bifunctional DNA-binding transcriptional regulator/antitoxin component of YhaV-PrlF toxin-antitoxin module
MSNLQHHLTNCVARVYSRGKINLPAYLKEDLALHDGDQVIFIKNGNSWTITTRNAWIKDAQSYAQALNPENDSMVDELISQRRIAAQSELL